jgi:hypothetical protein
VRIGLRWAMASRSATFSRIVAGVQPLVLLDLHEFANPHGVEVPSFPVATTYAFMLAKSVPCTSDTPRKNPWRPSAARVVAPSHSCVCRALRDD